MSDVQPGWYPDPAGAPEERYWDGGAWTSQTRPYPPPPALPKTPALARSTAHAKPTVLPNRASGSKRRTWAVVAVVLGAAVILTGTAIKRHNIDKERRRAAFEGSYSQQGAGSTSPLNQPAIQDVTYRVSVSGFQDDPSDDDASLTYRTPTGTSQERIEGGWSRTFKFDRGAFVYLSAQNLTEGFISCSIEIDGRTVSHNSSRGRGSIVTCDES